jgi:hypothetical protein
MQMTSVKYLIVIFFSILLTACASTPVPERIDSLGVEAIELPGECRVPPKMLQKDHLLSGDENACAYFGDSGFFRNLFTDESGNRLELYCHEREYALLYVSAKGYSRQIGRCPWIGGINQAYITHTGDRNPPEGVDCIEKIMWRTEESHLFVVGYPYGDRYQIDWKEFTYSPSEDKLVMQHFKSSDGPGGKEPDSLVKMKISYGQSITDDILAFNPSP